MTAATASANVGSSATADAVAGAQAFGKKGKGKANFADVLSSLLSSQNVQPQAVPAQDNISENISSQNAQPQIATAQNNISKHKQAAFAQVNNALHAGSVANDDTSDDSADALSALAAKMTGSAASGSAGNAIASTTPQTSAAPVQATQPAKYTGAKHVLTATTQAKLVSALAQAANAPPKIVGSDGQTAASSNNNGTPADAQAAQTAQAQPASSETPADTANILAALQTAQPVVTTVAASADKTAATITPRSMTQLEKAALGNTAQQSLHSAAPVAKTEAQALTMPTNTNPANNQDGSGAHTGTGQKQSHDSNDAQLTADVDKSSNSQSQQMPVPDAPQPTAPAAQTASNAAISNTASSIGDNGISPAGTVPPTTIATTLQVAQHSAASSSTSPDLAALAVSIAAKSKNGQNEFNIRMDPADLGRVDVRLSVDAAGKAQAHLTADKPQTLALLQQDSHKLASSLKDAGLDLSNNGLNFSLKGEQQNSTPTFIARNRALSIASVQTTDTASSTSSTSSAPGDSRLDIRV